MNVSFCLSTNTGVSMCSRPSEIIVFEFILTSLVVPSIIWMVCKMGNKWQYSCCFVNTHTHISIYLYIHTVFVMYRYIIIISSFFHHYEFYFLFMIIIMSCRQHGYPWPSLSTSPYHSSPLAGLQGYIPYPHIAVVCMFELVVLLLLGHMWGSIGVYHLWARPYFSSSVLHVWFV